MIRKTMLAVGVSLALSMAAQQASAVGTIFFDRDGAGGSGAILVDKMNWNPNSALFDNLITQTTIDSVLGPVTGPPSFNDTWDLLAQGSLGNTEPGALGPPNCILANCFLFGDDHVTFELGLTMATDALNSTLVTSGQSTIDATLSGGGTNFFKVYYDPTATDAGDPPDAGAGTGFGPLSTALADPDRIEILSGTIVSAPLTFNLDQGDTDLRKQDSFNADNRTGIGTFVGNGSVQFDIRVDSQDTAFFVSDLTTISIGTFLTTTLSTPFGQVDPALSVLGVTPDYGNDTVTGTFTKAGLDPVGGTRTMDDFTCGPADGGGAGDKICDTLVQTQWTQSFNNPLSVPEPATLALMGLGLIGMGAFRRRRGQTK